MWHDDQGWGVLDSPDTPGGCWAHFSRLPDAGGLRAAAVGARVSFTFETLTVGQEQDGFLFRAVAVEPSPA
ncbi:hypothetical protein [uncultured Micrococcus sp.]|uniref:hypothetical protein n=1 Tax=uncultured Micrococcus sp. TaxID=114051 RepID=UPI0025D25FC0|nr:hypothetical protein [uncultured Micrococcus sp.]